MIQVAMCDRRTDKKKKKQKTNGTYEPREPYHSPSPLNAFTPSQFRAHASHFAKTPLHVPVEHIQRLFETSNPL
jgi:hypothetical protein